MCHCTPSNRIPKCDSIDCVPSPSPVKVAFSHISDLLDSLEFEYERIGTSTTVVCYAFLPNGFSVGKGDSACVDPDNFDLDLGKKYAKERAVTEATNELWKLEGYLLKITGKTSDKL